MRGGEGTPSIINTYEVEVRFSASHFGVFTPKEDPSPSPVPLCMDLV